MEVDCVVPNIYLKAKKNTRIDRVDVSIKVQDDTAIALDAEPAQNPIIKGVGVDVLDGDIPNSVDDIVFHVNRTLVPKPVPPRKDLVNLDRNYIN